MAIKSRSLLPGDEVDLEDDLDPRDELIERLIEYRKLQGQASERPRRPIPRPRGAFVPARARVPRRGPLRRPRGARDSTSATWTIWDLLEHLVAPPTRDQRPTGSVHVIVRDPHPLRYYVEATVRAIASRRPRNSDAVASSIAKLRRCRRPQGGRGRLVLRAARARPAPRRQGRPGGAPAAEIEIELKPEHEKDIEEVVAVTSGLGDSRTSARRGGDHRHARAGATDAASEAYGPAVAERWPSGSPRQRPSTVDLEPRICASIAARPLDAEPRPSRIMFPPHRIAHTTIPPREPDR